MKDSDLNNDKKPGPGRGGARPGAGRPQGTKDRITIQSLLTAFESASNGQRYEDVLFQDFFTARDSGDMVMAHKYHNLILNKLAPTLIHTEVEHSGDAVLDRAQAFQAAIQAIVEDHQRPPPPQQH